MHWLIWLVGGPVLGSLILYVEWCVVFPPLGVTRHKLGVWYETAKGVVFELEKLPDPVMLENKYFSVVRLWSGDTTNLVWNPLTTRRSTWFRRAFISPRIMAREWELAIVKHETERLRQEEAVAPFVEAERVKREEEAAALIARAKDAMAWTASASPAGSPVPTAGGGK
jgi:hypothetical protein